MTAMSAVTCVVTVLGMGLVATVGLMPRVAGVAGVHRGRHGVALVGYLPSVVATVTVVGHVRHVVAGVGAVSRVHVVAGVAVIAVRRSLATVVRFRVAAVAVVVAVCWGAHERRVLPILGCIPAGGIRCGNDRSAASIPRAGRVGCKRVKRGWLCGFAAPRASAGARLCWLLWWASAVPGAAPSRAAPGVGVCRGQATAYFLGSASNIGPQASQHR
ncbi:hypothetical protein GCM10022262_39880 [Georgenia daeguensis]|uniref:Uncharacterized protein n=1 Tax=Georgenia daeguensis TaxID=908355 RepID=A0ABP6UQM1_9MICO